MGAEPLLQRIRELEAQVAEREETLDAIRRGEIDAVVVADEHGEQHVYALEGAERPYRLLIEQMQEAALTLNADGTITYCNRRLAAMLGLAYERLIGCNLQPFVLPDDSAGFQQLLQDARLGGLRQEMILHAADGRTLPAHVSLSLLDDADTTLLCGVLTDLTDQKIHLQELADANTRLSAEIAERERAENALRQAQKMEAIGQLTGGIAHDFNNMLQAITSGITLVQRRLVTGHAEQVPDLLESVLAAADRAARLTQRLLSFGRRQTLNPKLVELDSLIADVKALIERTVGPTITVTTRLTDDCWPIRCDPNQLENALLNLAINARDALMPDGGLIAITTDLVTLNEMETQPWRGVAPGDFVRITVTDTGCGMPPGIMARAFEPFFTTKPEGQGTGLGLSQIYGFIRQSQGIVRLDSAPGEGTSVHLYLPRARAEPDDAVDSAQPAPQRQAMPVVTTATVLLVEDEEIIREVTAEALRDLGYQVTEAEDGPHALAALQKAFLASGADAVRLLVTDIGLPGGMNGRQLADAARMLVPDLPILLITGYAGDAISGKGRLGPQMEILTKPFGLETLAEKVQAMIGLAAAA
ncbi:MAG: ATP-binding protein [Rhodopila sp.]